VDDHAPDLPAAAWVAFGWDTDVNRSNRLVDEAMDLGGRLMAECGPWPSSQYGGPQFGLSRKISRERGVCSALKPLPDPSPEPFVDGSLWPACIARLLPGDNPELGLKLAAPAQASFVFHVS